MTFEFEGEKVPGFIKLVKEVFLGNIFDKEKNKQSLLFLNSSLKNILRRIGYSEVGKSRRYFNMNRSEDLGDLLLYRGYETGFVTKLSGLLLKIEPVNRIIRKETVLSYISTLYEQHSNLTKEGKRGAVKDALVNRSVMANYGTSATWKVESVVFDKDMTSADIEGS